jgi:ornithine cyclodeaminase/alanine dehydrogenase-like protein (mu-crystallin family)
MMRKPIRIIKAGEIKQHYSMKRAIEAMHRAFAGLSSGEGFVPQRYVTSLPSGELVMLFKPAYVEKEQKITIKFLTQREGTAFPGIPTIQGVVLLIDALSGEMLSIMDGEYLTALRTGAASGLATRFFARKDARTLALFGCGTQGRTQLDAVKRQMPAWDNWAVPMNRVARGCRKQSWSKRCRRSSGSLTKALKQGCVGRTTRIASCNSNRTWLNRQKKKAP